jgi:hypothetical protein
VAASYGCDLVGNLPTLRYAKSVTNLYQYDSRNRLTNADWQAGSAALAMAAGGPVVGRTGMRGGSGARTAANAIRGLMK